MNTKNSFKLLISNPLNLSSMDKADTTISEALQTIYPYGKESSIYMKWNGYIIELNLTAQVSDIYTDILKMLYLLMDENIEEFDIHWGSNSFMAQWSFKKRKDNMLNIKAYWTSVIGGHEILMKLNKVKHIIEIKEKSFIIEWISLLEIIREDLLKVGYSSANLEDFDRTNIIIDKYSRKKW